MALVEYSVPVAQVCAICGTNPNSDSHLLCCAGCKHIRYCSKECQKRHWSYHKLICKRLSASSPPANGEGLDREGLLEIRHLPLKLNPHAIHYPAILLGLDNTLTGVDIKLGSPSESYKLQELPITSAFGIPLLMKVVPFPGSTGPHVYEKHFSTDPDPKSPTFGEPLIATSTDPASHALLLMRKDGGYLQCAQMKAIMFYVGVFLPKHVFGEIKRRQAAGEVSDREA
ncbi:hypothetical protein LTR10_005623 [Elasticomyces elasticus]|nr:hypothetical protein LTR10_005623 [Elasticomyces elasticus]KAK4976362.1 Ankyrin repeat and MYND domain-containing protein 2 [Elasticomyces elasticus]